VISQNTDTSDTSTEIQKIVDTASQMGHSTSQKTDASDDIIDIETIDDQFIQVIDYGSDDTGRYGRFEVRANGFNGNYDEYENLLADLIDELLI
jgi:hypothetical protein